MSKLSIEDKTMIAEGAEFKVGMTYFKYIEGIIYRHRATSSDWVVSCTIIGDYKDGGYYKGLPTYVDLRQYTATSSQPDQGDCIASKVHLLCVELQLMYSYLPMTKEFLVDYDETTFKLKTFEDIGKLRHIVTLIEELSYEE